MLLPPFEDHDLHQEILEALKAWQAAQDQLAMVRNSINGQYLKRLEAGEHAPQAEAMRALMGGSLKG